MERSDIVVLIVDDDPAMRNFLSAIIEVRGYSLLAASNGREAMSLARAYPGDIHLLISDVDMPQMDGLDLARQIIEERRGIRVLMVSGIERSNIKLPFLLKPFLPAELWQKIEQVLSVGKRDSDLLGNRLGTQGQERRGIEQTSREDSPVLAL